jgi:type II secretory pathway predicted ATPase ExeA
MDKIRLVRSVKELDHVFLFKCIYIPISTLTVMEFYRAICSGLGVIPSYKKVDMFKQIQEAIYTYHTAKNITPVIIVDEAQFLKNEVEEYILSRLKIAGCYEPIFTDNALELLFSSTNGCVRPLNSLARMCLIQGANQKLRAIDTEIVFQVQTELNITA